MKHFKLCIHDTCKHGCHTNSYEEREVNSLDELKALYISYMSRDLELTPKIWDAYTNKWVEVSWRQLQAWCLESMEKP